MAESPIQQFLSYPYRKWVVAGATILLMLVVSLPVYEQYARVRAESSEILDQIAGINQSLANLPAAQRREAETKSANDERQKLIDSDRALQIREELVRLVHNLDCRLLNIQLNEAQSLSWSPGNDPFAPKGTNHSNEESEFKLLRTRLSLSVAGSLNRITQFVERISDMHAFAVPASMQLRQQGEANTVEVQVELNLLNLKKDTT